MFERDKTARNSFAFSLGGLTTIASFVAAPSVDAERLNRTRDERQNQLRGAPASGKPGRLVRRRRSMQNEGAHVE